MRHCSILAANTANQSHELMDSFISMNWTMLAASSYAVRIPWGCSIQCPTSPCCLEMATVLMKGLHLRCAPRWELSIRVLDLFVKTYGMEFRNDSQVNIIPSVTSLSAVFSPAETTAPKSLGAVQIPVKQRELMLWASAMEALSLWDIGTQKSKKFLKNSLSTYEENYHEYTIWFASTRHHPWTSVAFTSSCLGEIYYAVPFGWMGKEWRCDLQGQLFEQI